MIENKNYTDPRKAAADRSVWRTMRRDGHKPAEGADYRRQRDAIGRHFPYRASLELELETSFYDRPTSLVNLPTTYVALVLDVRSNMIFFDRLLFVVDIFKSSI